MKPGRKRGQNAQQEAFAREYVIDNNAKAAAIRAGYAPKSVDTYGHRLLKLPAVKALIDKQREKIDSRIILTATETLERISAEAMNEGNNAIVRLRALELLAKHHGLLVERHEIGKPGEFAKMTDAEVDSELRELAERRQLVM